MGNCQAAEVATVLIQHPGGGRTERAYWAMSAGAVMAANPGHYVAAVITSPPAAAAGASSGAAAAPVKHLKLLRPDDTLLLGRVYRLVSFEEVLREFASKQHVKLSRVTIKAKEEVGEETKPTKPRRRRGSSGGVAPDEEYSSRSLAKVMRQSDEPEPVANPSVAPPKQESDIDDHAGEEAESDCDLEALLPPHGVVFGRRVGRQWRPALQSIAEGWDLRPTHWQLANGEPAGSLHR